MKGETLKIDFRYEPGEHDDDVDKRIAFWYSQNTFEWFENHGYTLYKPLDESCSTTVPRLPFLEDVYEGEFPYAAYDGSPAPDVLHLDISSRPPVPLRAYEPDFKVVFAQDRQNRHVAIKLVRRGTDECRILEFLKEQPLETLKENCVLPVLDILPIDGFCFVVMPRWGSDLTEPPYQTVNDVLQMMHAVLKGLAFLHRHNIIHGDLNIGNILIDNFRDGRYNEYDQLRLMRRAEGRARYGIFDFDFSKMFPQEINSCDCWIPVLTPYLWGTFNFTNDCAQGELEYNPFVTEVCTVGIMFSDYFQHVIPSLPILAPFFDMLTTHKLQQRFTASEALAFFEDFYYNLSDKQLQKVLPWLDGTELCHPYDDSDRWATVPSELAQKWAKYREPPLSWKTKALRKLFKKYKWLSYPKVVLVRYALAKVPKVCWAIICLVLFSIWKLIRQI
ncbi:hypothetical protein CPC08DRAFT_494012 [Agrocybe pediades]|nr:hypothetical protein CPC08DRAFT_494012 [Agrocybe pediades]